MKNNLFKKLLIVTCTACTLSLSSIPVVAAEYPDVSPSTWYYSYVQDVSGCGLMSGYNDGTFGPNDKLTRGQFATVIWRINGSPDMGNSSFSDVPATSFYAKASEWARATGVITGYSDGRFGGNDNINREQVATILYRYSGGEANGNIWEYPDADSVSAFARDGMAYAVGNGIISGDNGYLNPQGDVVRAVAATMISRFYFGNTVHQHNYDTFIQQIAATCETDGYDLYRCSCGDTQKKNTVSKSGHEWRHYNEVVHFEYEYESHTFCGTCGMDFGPGPEGAEKALDHIMSSDFYTGCQNYHTKRVLISERTVIEQDAYDECANCGKKR